MAKQETILKRGVVKYSQYSVMYKLVQPWRVGRYGASLYMRYAGKPWRYMDNVHPSIAGTALRQYARDYLLRIKKIKARY